MNKTCPKCHSPNRSEASFCTQCQEPFIDIVPTPRLCAAGLHKIDSEWASCPYCSDSVAVPPIQQPNHPPIPPLPYGAQPNHDPTALENPVGHVAPSPRPPVEPVRPPRITKFIPVDLPPINPGDLIPPQPGGRRIVALLVTYSRHPEGRVFPVYEGRNYLGENPDCEIRLNDDSQLSGHHAAIFYRSESFEISDEKSQNGTYVNGKSAPFTGMPLENYAAIKTGATNWRFIIINPKDLE